MTFPQTKFASISRFHHAYIQEIHQALASLDDQALQAAADLLEGVIRQRKWIFTCGNGGSAAIANHCLCDFGKGVRTHTPLKPRVSALSAHIESITAIANDMDYADIFAHQLASLASPGDLLITISASGNSENVVRAAQWARENQLHTLALTGFNGGRLREMAQYPLHIKADNYGVIEDSHQAILHMLAQYIRQKHMDEDRVAAEKF
ncbi:MAG: SIS domain-containing protein [Magnetococcales bacterium]|nr:SIS domain-containing protein [Magnetococcales bacterium]